jgi:CelD/BcsL family acetyltransferase involved in cellulose biosynthesis
VSRELSIRVVSNVDEFHRLASDWTALLRESESHGIFLTWEWLYQWTRHYLGANRLWILIVIDKDHRIRGIAPFYIRNVRSSYGVRYRDVGFLGTEEVCSSYLDLIAESAYKRPVWQRLYRFLFHEAAGEWDVLTLGEIPAASSTVGSLMSLFDDAGKVIEILKVTACPAIQLPRSCADYRRTLSGNRRYNLQRKRKALERLGRVSFRHIHKGPDVRRAFDWFVRLHEKRWTANGADGGAFHRERFLAFHQDIIKVFEENGWLSLSLLAVDDRPIAGIYGFVYKGTYYFYLPGFDPAVAPYASPGMLVLSHRIEQAIEEGLGLFDLLQGDASYKGAWASDIARSLTIRAYNRSSRGLVLKVVESAKQAVKILLR